MQREKRYLTEKEIQQAVRTAPTAKAAARLLGIGANNLSTRLCRGGLRVWWAALKARRKRSRRAARDRRSWNRSRDRALLQWVRAGGDPAKLGTRLRARLARAQAGVPYM